MSIKEKFLNLFKSKATLEREEKQRFADLILWRDQYRRSWKIRELEDSHLCNIIVFLREYHARDEYGERVLEAMIDEADRRGLTNEMYLEQVPHKCPDTDVWMRSFDASGMAVPVSEYPANQLREERSGHRQ